MKHLRIIIVALFIVAGINTADAQWKEAGTPWVIGVGINIVDDAGDAFGEPFNVEDNWNMVNPLRGSIEKHLKRGFSIEGLGTYNKYQTGKIIDGKASLSNQHFLALDLYLKYDLNNFIGETAWFDPFILAGYGFTHRRAHLEPKRSNRNTITNNWGLGFNVWLTRGIGFNFQSMGKLAIKNGPTHYIQHAVGIVFKIGGRSSEPTATAPKNPAVQSALDHLRSIINK